MREARVPYRPRFLNFVWAMLAGYFWLPCPNCGRILQEVHGTPGTVSRIKCSCNTWTIIRFVAAGIAEKSAEA